eukprot:COSAG04_NODE_1605_length_6179_cov_116.914638_1_plen_114_part_00
MGVDWAAVRREHFPGADTHAAYLNNSAVAGLLSAPAIQAVRDVTEAWAENPAAEIYDVFGGSMLERARQGLARMLGCEEGEVALTGNTTDGLSVAAAMVPPHPIHPPMATNTP